MLNVKHLTFFKPKNWKMVGISNENSKSELYNLVSRFSLILTKIWFSIKCKWV